MRTELRADIQAMRNDMLASMRELKGLLQPHELEHHRRTGATPPPCEQRGSCRFSPQRLTAGSNWAKAGATRIRGTLPGISGIDKTLPPASLYPSAWSRTMFF
jgi:hypothetical protein